jgi:hypothetical protein
MHILYGVAHRKNIFPASKKLARVRVEIGPSQCTWLCASSQIPAILPATLADSGVSEN